MASKTNANFGRMIGTRGGIPAETVTEHSVMQEGEDSAHSTERLATKLEELLLQQPSDRMADYWREDRTGTTRNA
eukprot:779019-Rhodomonas_salina.3